jgi:hypothetical protein
MLAHFILASFPNYEASFKFVHYAIIKRLFCRLMSYP